MTKGKSNVENARKRLAGKAKERTQHLRLEWRCHVASAPYSSDSWAASDRGWLFCNIVPCPRNFADSGVTYITLGHYLDYGGDTRVHAVSCVSRESMYVHTPEEARTWIKTQAKGREASFFADSFRGYEHEKAAIRAMKVRP